MYNSLVFHHLSVSSHKRFLPSLLSITTVTSYRPFSYIVPSKYSSNLKPYVTIINSIPHEPTMNHLELGQAYTDFGFLHFNFHIDYIQPEGVRSSMVLHLEKVMANNTADKYPLASSSLAYQRNEEPVSVASDPANDVASAPVWMKHIGCSYSFFACREAVLALTGHALSWWLSPSGRGQARRVLDPHPLLELMQILSTGQGKVDEINWSIIHVRKCVESLPIISTTDLFPSTTLMPIAREWLLCYYMRRLHTFGIIGRVGDSTRRDIETAKKPTL
jgi:hypothetical protein